jgi:hypothetical protein
MTSAINAVQIPTPKPRLPRRWVAVCNEISKHGASRTAYAFTSENEARLASGDAETLYALPASDELAKLFVCCSCDDQGFIERPCELCGKQAAKPVVSAIPTVVDLIELLDSHVALYHVRPSIVNEAAKAIHALVASRVVVHRPRILPVVKEQPPTIDPGELTLDPIKAIVELIDAILGAIRFAGDKLTALKRSLEPGSGE